MDARTLEFSNPTFHPVIKLPAEYEIYDFSGSYDPNRVTELAYGVGKFNELRPDMYKGELYDEDQRNIHIGIDIGAPKGTPVYSFTDATILLFADNDHPWDYGPTIITEQRIEGVEVFALYGHLSRRSLEGIGVGQEIAAGEMFAGVGEKSENGGWNPHLHFQLSLVRPKIADMPGVVSARDREEALKTYIDPRKVLGPLY